MAQLILEHSNDYLKHILCPREEGGSVNDWLTILVSVVDAIIPNTINL